MPSHPGTFRPNILGGKSLFLPENVDLDLVPSPYQELITRTHRQAYAAPGKYFGSLAEKAKLPSMKRWLATMAEANTCELQLHYVEMGRRPQTEVVFRGFTPGRKRHFDFLLAEDEETGDLPPPLDNLYSLINGTVESGYGEAGGLLKRNYFFHLEDVHDPERLLSQGERVLLFFRNNCGDCLLADKGRAIAWLHENNNIYVAGSLDEVLDSYFACLLTGSNWLFAPHY